jgi:tRNA A37 methylthiotransferase MiaB
MKETVIAINNRYENIRGFKKVKVLTKGKKYVYLKSGYSDVVIVNDCGVTRIYKSSLFDTISSSRNQKLESLGI